MLAIVSALESFHQYTFIDMYTSRSDYKPLEAILLRPRDRVARSLQLIMMRLQKYDFTLYYEHGKNMHLADMLSRVYLPDKGKEVDDLESRKDRSVRVITEYSRRMA